MTHISDAGVIIRYEGREGVIENFSGGLVDEEDAKVIYTALTLFILSIPQRANPTTSAASEITSHLPSWRNG